jgi:NAD(P)-dependent dehydrogenase (short-subunit alcohol dehydrogenase family)
MGTYVMWRKRGEGKPVMLNGEPGVGRLSGRVAIVTGSGRGLGLDIARALHSAKARVAICGRHEDVLAAAAQSLDPPGRPGIGRWRKSAGLFTRRSSRRRSRDRHSGVR